MFRKLLNQVRAVPTIFTVCAFALVLFFSHELEASQLGKSMRDAAYDYLQYLLEVSNWSEARIIVVDVDGIPGPDTGDRAQPTDFGVLMDIAGELKKAGAKAVGLDILLDPLEKTAPAKESPAKQAERLFISQCVAWSHDADRPFNVYLSTDHISGDGRHLWLDDLGAHKLMVHIKFFEHQIEEAEGEIKRQPVEGIGEVRQLPLSFVILPEHRVIPSLAQALVGGDEPSLIPPQLQVTDFQKLFYTSTAHLEKTFPDKMEGLPQGYELDYYPVNFGVLKTIQQSRIPATTGGDISRNAAAFENHYVIIGRVKKGGDEGHSIPGPDRVTVAGVFIHACGAWTLLEAPLRELTPRGQILVDLVLTTTILLFISLCTLLIETLKITQHVEPFKFVAPFLLGVLFLFLVTLLIVHVRLPVRDILLILIGALYLHPLIHRLIETIHQHFFHEKKAHSSPKGPSHSSDSPTGSPPPTGVSQ